MALRNYEQCIELLQQLELHELYPKKITKKYALRVPNKVSSHTELRYPSQIPWFMFDNLTTCNCEAMSFVLSGRPNAPKSKTSLSCFLGDSEASPGRDPVQIHPLDVLTSLLLCCDDFLRQTLVENLSKCQLGIPLLLPVIDAAPQTCGIEMLCWATSTLRKQWKTSSGSSLERSMAVHPLPILSALRVGRPRISKSKILNRIISKHDHFVHFECKGGTVKRLISNGVLEMMWYLPMGNDGDNFPNAFGIMNLRGNAHDHWIQKEFVTEASSTTIIFCQSDMSNIDEMDLITSWNDQHSHLILVFDGKPTDEWKPILQSVSAAYQGGKLVHLIFKEHNKDVVQPLKDVIKECMSVTFPGQTTPKSLEQCEQIATNCTIRIDDKDKGDNFETKLKANDLMNYLEGHHKHNILPLQSITYNIAKKKREMLHMKRRGRMETEMYLEKMKSEIMDLRKEQSNLWETPSEMVMIKHFLESFTFTSPGRSYFYNWMGTMLDRYSIQHLQRVREDYNAAWKSQCESRNQGVIVPVSSESGISATTDLESFQQTLRNASVGLENLNREIAQVYEMKSDMKMMNTTVKRFPEIAAEMLFDGQPLEIMDGDATYVPVTWLKAVFTCLMAKLGNAKMFVLSILGVQGSGKSTMLNTMFGLKFAVGAGRCTKGAFAQLVPLGRNQSKFEYILVVDTEGLRAPEFASIEHSNRDNEMATFVIGLGDATVINVMGENQTDIQDTLQIVVYALMKMKSVNLKPSCIFVHQNVSDVSASEKSTTQRIQLRKILDQTTKISAEAQRKTVNSFADVINFKEEKHVAHISNLWQGDPPMAPPNPGYVRCVLELRRMIFGLMEEVHGNTIDEFQQKLADLYKAVLCEDFVFSFKNTLEIQAYTALETEYLQVSRDFRQTCMSNCNALANACKKIPAMDIEVAGKKISEDHMHKLLMSYNSFFNHMKEYFKITPRAAQWEADIKKKMSTLNTEMRKTLNEEFRIVKQTVIWKSKIDQGQMKYELEIHKKSRELAEKSRDSGKSESELECQFNESWKAWIADIPELDNLIDIKVKLEDVLLNTFTKENDVIQDLLKNIKDINEVGVTEDDIAKNKKTSMFSIGFKKISDASLKEAQCSILKYRDSAVSLIDYHKGVGSNCNEHILKEIVDVVAKLLEHPPNPANCVSFTHDGIAKNTFCILWKLLPDFKALQEAFKEQNDPRAYMSSQKENLWQIFQNECAMVETALTTAFKCSIPLRNATNRAIKLSFVESVIDHFRTSPDHKHAFANKRHFHAKMLIDLAEKKSFKLATGYLANPSFRMSCWLQEYILSALKVETSNGRTVLQHLYEKCVGRQYEQAKEATKIACKSIRPACKIDNLWQQLIRNFEQIMIPVISIQSQILCENGDIQVEDFLNELVKKLNAAEMIMKRKCHTASTDILEYTIAPVVNFFEKDIIGCEELCPFCQAPCDNLAGCTNHRTECHRPQGFGGHRWDETNKLVADLCTTTVGRSDRSFRHTDVDKAWHSYHEYRHVNEQYKSWNITPMEDTDTQLYWKWFMAKYNKKLAKFHGCEKAEIPESWKNIEWKSAKMDMIALYNLNTDTQATV